MANDSTLNPLSSSQVAPDAAVTPLAPIASATPPSSALQNAPYADAALNPPTELPAAGPQDATAFQVPLPAATAPLVPVEPIATRLSDAWSQEQAAPLGQVNPAVMPALPDAAVFASSAPQELIPPSASQLPDQAAEAHPQVVEQVTGGPSVSDFSLPSNTSKLPDLDTPPSNPFAATGSTSEETLLPEVTQALDTQAVDLLVDELQSNDPTMSSPAQRDPAPSELLPAEDSILSETNDVALPPADQSAPAEVDESTAETDEDKKTPLEILEEILAGANAEKDLKDKEEQEKKEKEEKEKAEFAAKEAVFEAEAATRLAETAVQLQEAKEQRQHVDQEFAAKNPVVVADDTLTINQLTRDTIETNE